MRNVRNAEHLVETAEMIAGLPEEQFGMHTYTEVHGCGTVACIAGWLDIRIGNTVNKNVNRNGYLGISHDEARILFIPKHYCTRRPDARDHAAGALLLMAEGRDLPEDWWSDTERSYACGR